MGPAVLSPSVPVGMSPALLSLRASTGASSSLGTSNSLLEPGEQKTLREAKSHHKLLGHGSNTYEDRSLSVPAQDGTEAAAEWP